MRLLTYILADFFSTIIRLLDLSTKVWYICTQDFKSSYLFYLFIAALVTPFFVNTLIFFLLTQKSLRPGICNSLLFILFDLFALNYAIYTYLRIFHSQFLQHLKILTMLFSLSPIVTNTFQSTPLLLIQLFNTDTVNDWGSGKIVTVCATGGSFFVTLIQFCMPRDEIVNTKVDLIGRNEVRFTEGNQSKNKSDGTHEKEVEVRVLNLD